MDVGITRININNRQ